MINTYKTAEKQSTKADLVASPGKTNIKVDKNGHIVNVTQAWNTDNTTIINLLFNLQNVHLNECHENCCNCHIPDIKLKKRKKIKLFAHHLLLL